MIVLKEETFVNQTISSKEVFVKCSAGDSKIELKKYIFVVTEFNTGWYSSYMNNSIDCSSIERFIRFSCNT